MYVTCTAFVFEYVYRYNISMSLSPLQTIINEDPQLVWYVSQDSVLSTQSIFEHILNFGSWDQVQKAISILGIDEAAKLFKQLAKKSRSNLKPRVKHYFNLYFHEHAPNCFI